MSDAPPQARGGGQSGAGLADFERGLALRRDFGGRETFRRLQEPIAHVGAQPQRRRHGDVGNQMRRVFEPQTIFDQAGGPRLAQDFLKNGCALLVAQTSAKLR